MVAAFQIGMLVVTRHQQDRMLLAVWQRASCDDLPSIIGIYSSTQIYLRARRNQRVQLH
jgi:hypothetical protein